jgi:hypothetical protein
MGSLRFTWRALLIYNPKPDLVGLERLRLRLASCVLVFLDFGSVVLRLVMRLAAACWLLLSVRVCVGVRKSG